MYPTATSSLSVGSFGLKIAESRIVMVATASFPGISISTLSFAVCPIFIVTF